MRGRSTAGGRGCGGVQWRAEDGMVIGSQDREPEGFIELGSPGSGSSRCEIRLDLGGGVVLQVMRG